jgi:hypothetical protein
MQRWTAHPPGRVHALLRVGERVWSCGEDRMIRVWPVTLPQSPEPVEPFASLSAHKAAVRALALHEGPAGLRVLSGDLAGAVACWDPASLNLLRTVQLAHPVACLGLSSPIAPTARLWVAAGAHLYILDLPSLEIFRRCANPH